MPLSPGIRLGTFEVLRPIGAGGMGEVYRARDTRLGRDVALKVLPEAFAQDGERMARFEREAQVLASLNHPHIAAIYGLEESAGIRALVMELVEGPTLAQRIAAGAIPLVESLRIAQQIAEALAYAHQKGVVHRDIKPSNVILATNSGVRLIDFGLARNVDTTVTLDSASRGTPAYMSPEQAKGEATDLRTDLWSAGIVLYEMLAGRRPFRGGNYLQVTQSIVNDPAPPLQQLRPDLPDELARITAHALEKDPAKRYQSAGEMAGDLAAFLAQLSGAVQPVKPAPLLRPRYAIPAAMLILLVGASGFWLYQRSEKRRWAREQAIPGIKRLRDESKSLAAFLLLRKAEPYLPGDAELAHFNEDATRTVSIHSTPPGATVEIKDYLSPDEAWFPLGTTPLEKVAIPKGYFRWRVKKQGMRDYLAAPMISDSLDFDLASEAKAPEGMAAVPAGEWGDFIDYIGWVGPYQLPPYAIDRFEVTNRQYQDFVDHGGYQKPEYWRQEMIRDGRKVSWEAAMALFRDNSGRPGPSTWEAGHYPEGQADYPVAGVSWYEAAAYAAYAGKSLPAIAQWYNAAPTDVAMYATRHSNFSPSGPAQVGKFAGIGPYGTYDMAGNVREWSWNASDEDRRYILGGAWKTQTYMAYVPEALPPFDRSATNGLRCVRNSAPLAPDVLAPRMVFRRDFSRFKPASDEVFQAYRAAFAYDPLPLNAKVERVMEDTADWKKEKITFDAAYGGERMPAYLFLPKHVKPPYQTIVFFPSARVLDIPNSETLGDLEFVDYAIKNGRAVMYPVYQETYERRPKGSLLPGQARDREAMVQMSRDLGRSIDYLETRADIDKKRLAYLSVSMGTAYGVILTTLEDRLKAVVFMDGGFFMNKPAPGIDQADFAPRLKKPVLMINGRYDISFPLDASQLPLFRMIGTPEKDKRHVLLDTPHDVLQKRDEMVREVLAWLDKYLGPVGY